MKHESKQKEKKKKGWLKEYLRSAAALRVLICIVSLAILVALFEVAIVPVRYNLKVGMVPNYTIAATKDVVDEVSTQKQRELAASQVTPTYRYQEGITEEVLADFDQIFAQLRAVRQYGATLPNPSANRVYTKDELQYAKDMLTLITLRDYQISTLLRCSQEELEEAYTLLYAALQSMMQSHVTEGQEYVAVNSIRQIVNYRISIPIGQNIVPALLNSCIQPNMLIDQEATDAAREEARQAVEPVVYKQGQNIVVRGEGRVTSGQLQMLSTLGLLSDSGVDLPMYLGAAALVLLVIGGLLFLLREENHHILNDTSRLILLFAILIVSLGLCILARLINAYLAPVLLCGMLVTVLLGVRPGLLCNAAMALLVAFLAAGGSEEYTEKMVLMICTGIISGSVTVLTISHRVHGNRFKVLLAGLVACLIDFATILSIGLMTANNLSGSLANAFYRIGGTLISTLLCIALQPLLEMIFNLPTPIKLMELSNPNQPLLRRLLLEAPGTYHHSTIVANLAEAAAEAVDANPLLARVGGYYHDVGKLKRPLYFKENQLGGQNAHDHTDPRVSAAIVTSHTRDGVQIAKSYRLPQEVLDIIAGHHGDTPVMFFYHKALQQADGKPVDMDSFRYEAKPPSTKEGAIVMMCDTIEAAVRSLKNPTPESIEDFIVKLVRGKLEDGQLSDTPLTFRDIDKICSAAAQVLIGVFHERIEYPDMEDDKVKKAQAESQAAEEKQETEKEAAPEQEAASAPAALDSMTLLDPETKEPMHVVIPEVLPQAMKVEPPAIIRPVVINKLDFIEPLPTKADEEALRLQELGKQAEQNAQTEDTAAAEENKPQDEAEDKA